MSPLVQWMSPMVQHVPNGTLNVEHGKVAGPYVGYR